MKAFFEAGKFQYFEFFRPSLGKKSANKGKIKRWRGKFSPPQCQKTPRRPAEAMFFLLRKIAEYAVKPFQKNAIKSLKVSASLKSLTPLFTPLWSQYACEPISSHTRTPTSPTADHDRPKSHSLRAFLLSPLSHTEPPPTAKPMMGGSEPSVRV